MICVDDIKQVCKHNLTKTSDHFFMCVECRIELFTIIHHDNIFEFYHMSAVGKHSKC
jgi:hypothetical protein